MTVSVPFNIPGMSGSSIGLAVTQTMTLTGTLQWGMRMSSEVANIMTSVERILVYLGLKPEETEEGNFHVDNFSGLR